MEMDLGEPGGAPRSRSSRLGCVAAVTAIVSPSHPSPAVSQRMCSSRMAGSRWVIRPWGTDASAMRSLSSVACIYVTGPGASDGFRRNPSLALRAGRQKVTVSYLDVSKDSLAASAGNAKGFAPSASRTGRAARSASAVRLSRALRSGSLVRIRRRAPSAGPVARPFPPLRRRRPGSGYGPASRSPGRNSSSPRRPASR